MLPKLYSYITLQYLLVLLAAAWRCEVSKLPGKSRTLEPILPTKGASFKHIPSVRASLGGLYVPYRPLSPAKKVTSALCHPHLFGPSLHFQIHHG